MYTSYIELIELVELIELIVSHHILVVPYHVYTCM